MITGAVVVVYYTVKHAGACGIRGLLVFHRAENGCV